ncbi:MAG: hypothetical protein AAF415_02515 [Pseudomonadota bacterium]
MTRARQTLRDAFPEARFRPLDGLVELGVAEAASDARSRPARVTEVLSLIYEDLAPDNARRVASAGREWLLQKAATQFQGAQRWFETTCTTCGTPFDLEVHLDQVPRAEPGPDFPVADVVTSLGPRQFEAPNGGHEEAFAEVEADDPRRVFAALCGISDVAEAEAIRFTDADLAGIDAALEATSPEIADGVDTICPACHASTLTRIDPLGFAFPKPAAILAEVHLLAQTYGWGEAEILALPITRRQSYASLIRRDRGVRAPRPGRRVLM